VLLRENPGPDHPASQRHAHFSLNDSPRSNTLPPPKKHIPILNAKAEPAINAVEIHTQ